ncbi:MAG: hypothetical protein UR46_C0034G0006 [Parcubacteria group bacterium GW2011_GWA1_33_6]|uniref:Uncharacterized protein n=1 Tax=Candidatus Staskawiczbacteria bacterium RIFCSPHIGHO2_02_FULL_33_16 TaxID=1802204 RepID=A0A1G2HYG0_9BACT|nr:MAG: hypothetical protein UR31_C0028G0007 [Parcubacteria group bacterium GW2011_GWA2_33_14]KKP53438.1 MAG: hypothetical protein UR46_C0034G0006 [Parcubacteria group bacterium GW2011_GWA1_33_6]OGZ67231.1 MAG: hypothetical protein A3D34_00390 [Candidatus Staskawiczbacteria bacterium RIFCSPHIGHO2_02_FULL_33_16]OGZ70922.1 MAG: hypothetical protein A2980_02800 [Candidatus Staskawiczbacteria bacterium RIFCSPLOWO2_01_FULL_33_13]
MNKKLVLFFALSILLVLPVLSLAIDFPAEPGARIINIQEIINGILLILWWIFLTIVIISFLITGILFLTAQGDQGKLDKLKKAVIWGLVGILVAILAFSIISITNNVIYPPPPPPPPPPPTGVCCSSYTCIANETLAYCNGIQGTYKGDGTTCSTVTCP